MEGTTSHVKKIAVYTAIFGEKDDLIEPTFVPEDCDFICFTDQPFRSKIWRIQRASPPIAGDMTRSNRYYKILAHRVLPEYEYSIYVDGNILIRGDVAALLTTQLRTANMAMWDHARWAKVPLSSLREEMEQLYRMERDGKHQEDEDLMRKQAESYFADGFPDSGGLSWNCVLIRKHLEPDVVRTMEAWWDELKKWSKRDQISFNYVAWKTGLRFNYIPFDGSDNPYTKRLNHRLPFLQKCRSYVYGALKRLRAIFT